LTVRDRTDRSTGPRVGGRAGLRILGLLVAATVACGGGGGGGGGGPTPPPPGITFTASGGSTTNALNLGLASGSSATVLRLDLSAQSMTNLYGVAFDLLYPSQVLAFDSVVEGSFLAGAATSLQIEEPTPGRLIIGLSRLGAVSGVSGSGTVLTLQFSSRGVAGNGSLTFASNTAFNSAGGAIAGVAWGGGSVSVAP
jgi:predicted outer membrane repeat protein